MSFLDKINAQIKGYFQSINAWPQYRKIALGIILLGFLLVIIGLLLY